MDRYVWSPKSYQAPKYSHENQSNALHDHVLSLEMMFPGDMRLNLSRHWLMRSRAKRSEQQLGSCERFRGEDLHQVLTINNELILLHLRPTMPFIQLRFWKANLHFLLCVSTRMTCCNLFSHFFVRTQLFSVLPLFFHPFCYITSNRLQENWPESIRKEKEGNIYQHPIWQREKHQAILSEPFPV